MNDETVPGGLQMCDQITVGSRSKGKRRRPRSGAGECLHRSCAECITIALRSGILLYIFYNKKLVNAVKCIYETDLRLSDECVCSSQQL